MTKGSHRLSVVIGICFWGGILTNACSSSSFSGANAAKKSTSPTDAANGNVAAAAGVNDGVSNGNANAGSSGNDATKDGANGNAVQGAGGAKNIDTQGNLLACPVQNQVILVLDFKSGWWSGDGGDFVDRIISNGLSLPCKATVKLEYHHLILSGSLLGSLFGGQAGSVDNMQLVAPTSPQLTAGSGDFATAILDPTWASYNQIWVLSGSAADPEDLQINHPFFQQVLAKIKASKATFFIGAGYGSISHAVAVAQTLGLGASFSTALPEGNILNAMLGVQILSTISGAAFAGNSVILTSGVTTVADELIVGGEDAHGDNIVDLGGINILATDNHHQITLATSKDSRVVFDADLPRYYASAVTTPKHDTMHLLQNILVYLAQ